MGQALVKRRRQFFQRALERAELKILCFARERHTRRSIEQTRLRELTAIAQVGEHVFEQAATAVNECGAAFVTDRRNVAAAWGGGGGGDRREK